MQRDFAALGNAKRKVERVELALIAACTDIRDAVDICLREAGLTQRGIAAQINVDESYISLMFKGKRYWTAEVLSAITARTGCAAIRQYEALRDGYVLALPGELKQHHGEAPMIRELHSKRLPGRVAA
jgi:hypothetical protein